MICQNINIDMAFSREMGEDGPTMLIGKPKNRGEIAIRTDVDVSGRDSNQRCFTKVVLYSTVRGFKDVFTNSGRGALGVVPGGRLRHMPLGYCNGFAPCGTECDLNSCFVDLLKPAPESGWCMFRVLNGHGFDLPCVTFRKRKRQHCDNRGSSTVHLSCPRVDTMGVSCVLREKSCVAPQQPTSGAIGLSPAFWTPHGFGLSSNNLSNQEATASNATAREVALLPIAGCAWVFYIVL